MSKHIIHLLGDSLIDYGNWKQLLPGYTTISDGVPGELTEALLPRLPANRNEIKPDTFIIMTGANNLIMYGDSSFTTTLKQIITNLADNHPEATIILTSLLPFNIHGVRKSVVAVNTKFKAIVKDTGTVYLDLFTPFEQSSEQLFGFDGVHLSDAGYRLWSVLLAKMLPPISSKKIKR